MTDEEIIAGAKAIAGDMLLPGGSAAKLAKVVGRHLQWFESARQRGMTWDDIIAVLFEAGVRREGHLPLSRGHLSSLIWRKNRTVTKSRDYALVHPTGCEDVSLSPVGGEGQADTFFDDLPSTLSREIGRGKGGGDGYPSAPVARSLAEVAIAPSKQPKTASSPHKKVGSADLARGDKAALRKLLQRAAEARSQKHD